MAEGVRLYSQETWRQVTMGKGVELVEKYIDSVVSERREGEEVHVHVVIRVFL